MEKRVLDSIGQFIKKEFINKHACAGGFYEWRLCANCSFVYMNNSPKILHSSFKLKSFLKMIFLAVFLEHSFVHISPVSKTTNIIPVKILEL